MVSLGLLILARRGRALAASAGASPVLGTLSWDEMAVVVDHLGLPATNAEAAAQWFAEILGLESPVADGPDGDMYNVALSGESAVLFVTAPAVSAVHVAFGVSASEFAAIVDRLRERGISFGNGPEAPTNGATADPLGGPGRVYFRSPDDHFLEVTVHSVS